MANEVENKLYVQSSLEKQQERTASEPCLATGDPLSSHRKVSPVTPSVPASEIDGYVQKIEGTWKKTLDGILDTAKLCAEASDKLNAKDKARLLGQLSFRPTTFSKLAKVGKDERLRRPGIIKYLPPNYSTLYAVAKLDDKQLDEAIDSGALHHEARRADIEALTRPKSDKLSPPPFAYVRVPPEYSEDRLPELEARLRAVASEFEVTLVKRMTEEERTKLAHE
jgi:hypothetical protein